MLINALRGHCADFGIVAPAGADKAGHLVAVVRDAEDTRSPPEARSALAAVVEQFDAAEAQMRAVAARLLAWRRGSEICRRLETIPGPFAPPRPSKAIRLNRPAVRLVARHRELACTVAATGGSEAAGSPNSPRMRSPRPPLFRSAHDFAMIGSLPFGSGPALV